MEFRRDLPEVLSYNLHGLKFNKLIGNCITFNFKYNKILLNLNYIRNNIIVLGDGDSSISKKLELVPYGPHQLVQKIECQNHLLRKYKIVYNSKKFKIPAIFKKSNYKKYY